jgi:DNA polymerase III subunit beta
MKLTIPRKGLVSALNVVKSAATAKGTLPILTHVALQTKGNKLTLACTDLEINLWTKTEATVDTQGAATVNAALLSNLVQSFSGEHVELIALTNDLKIACGDSKWKLSTMPIDEIPPAAKLKDPVGFSLPQHTLRRLLAETSFCQGTDEARIVLCSSLLRLNGSLTAASCDGRRVAVESSKLDSEEKVKTDLILPPKAIRELLRLLSTEIPEEGKPAIEVRVNVGTNLGQFDMGNTMLTTKLIEGSYPDFYKVIPEDTKDGVPVGRADLLNILKRVSLIADQCRLEFSGQTLTVRARGTKECPGEAVESLLIPKTKEVSVSFNAQYLIDALAATEEDTVFVHVRDAKSPCMMKIPSKSWTCVTMCMTDQDKKEEPKKEETKK